MSFYFMEYQTALSELERVMVKTSEVFQQRLFAKSASKIKGNMTVNEPVDSSAKYGLTCCWEILAGFSLVGRTGGIPLSRPCPLHHSFVLP